MRIVTLLPSATAIVEALGLGPQLVGVSHCCAPASTTAPLPAVTSTTVPYREDSETIDRFVREYLQTESALYALDLPLLTELAPDVVISQALCDVCAVATGEVTAAIEALPSKPLLVDLTPNVLDDVLEDIARVGEATDRLREAGTLVNTLRARRDRVAERSVSIPRSARPHVGFLEWLLPPFNGGHWNPELVELAGGIDALGQPGTPSRTLDWRSIAEADPAHLFIACCGFGVQRTLTDIDSIKTSSEWLGLRAVQRGAVHVADGNRWFASPGPALIDGLEVLAHALHPEVHPPAQAGRALNLTG